MSPPPPPFLSFAIIMEIMNSIYISLLYSWDICSKSFTIQYYPRQTWYIIKPSLNFLESMQPGSHWGAQRLEFRQYRTLLLNLIPQTRLVIRFPRTNADISVRFINSDDQIIHYRFFYKSTLLYQHPPPSPRAPLISHKVPSFSLQYIYCPEKNEIIQLIGRSWRQKRSLNLVQIGVCFIRLPV